MRGVREIRPEPFKTSQISFWWAYDRVQVTHGHTGDGLVAESEGIFYELDCRLFVHIHFDGVLCPFFDFGRQGRWFEPTRVSAGVTV